MRKLILKSALLAVVLFCFHYICASLCPSIKGYMGQRDKNVMVIDNYVYGHEHFDKVCVGSSMTEKIIADSIPGLYNLGLLACCAMDGLEFIAMKPKDELPKTVYVEMNNAHSNSLNKFLQEEYKPGFGSFLKGIFPNMRKEYAPVTMFKSACVKTLKGEGRNNIVPVDTATLSRSIAYLKEDGWLKWGRHLDYEGCSIGFRMLKERLDILQARGVKIVFFWVPMNKTIEQGPRMSDLKAFIYKFFPASQYSYMPMDETAYPTSDGIHLDDMSARQFTMFFKSHCE